MADFCACDEFAMDDSPDSFGFISADAPFPIPITLGGTGAANSEVAAMNIIGPLPAVNALDEYDKVLIQQNSTAAIRKRRADAFAQDMWDMLYKDAEPIEDSTAPITSGAVASAIAGNIDETLSVQGKAADAKATGDAVGELKSAIGYLRVGDRVFTQADLVQGSYNSSGAVTASTTRIRTKGFIRVNKGEKIVFKKGSNATEMLIGYFTTANVHESDSTWFGNITIEATSDKNLIFVFRKTSSNQTIAPSDYDADTKIVYPITQYEESVGTKVEQTTIGIDNLMADLPDIPFAYTETSSSNLVTLFNSYYCGAYYADLKTGKYYLSIIKFDIKADDTSTVGTVRLVPTKKNTASTEPMTTISRKDVSMASAPKGSSQYVYHLGTVSENLSVFYKLVSYSSGTTSRYYDGIITAVVCLEFATQTEAENFIAQHIGETTQDGWRTAIDLIAREDIKTKNTILSQNPYTGKTCVVIGDSLSASYYDMWCSYFASETGITLTNKASGGTSVAVRDGRSDSFYERVLATETNYDLWIIFGGMNDKDGVPVGDLSSSATTTFYGAYKAILANIQARANHPQVIMIAPYYNVDAILPYITAIRDIAEHYGVPLVDLAKISGVNPGTRSIYTRDWTHPNQLLCDRIRPQITRELCEKIVFPEETPAMPH